jgi:hypothetical protein
VALIYIIHGSIICNVTFGYSERCAGQFSNGLVVSPFHKCARSYDLHVLGARWLGAGAPLTILQFALLVRLCLVLGFHAIYSVCSRFIEQGCIL